MGHKEFILQPIESILQEALSAMQGLPVSICNQPLKDFIVQSTFIRMTGAQEQKFKCACWELASVNYDFRYGYIKGATKDFQFNECSNLDDKNKILKHLSKYVDLSNLSQENSRIRTETFKIFDCFQVVDSTLNFMFSQEYDIFIDFWNTKVRNCDLYSNNTFLSNDLSKTYYTYLYKQRNRCAHNLTSYQMNYYKLSLLKSDEYQYNNYLIFFALLIIIDKYLIFIFEKFYERFKGIE